MSKDIKNLKVYNVLKKNILGIVVGGIVAGGVTSVCANALYDSKDIKYDDNENVKDTLDGLYDKYLNKGANVDYLGEGLSFDLTSYPNYDKFTVDNFVVGSKTLTGTISCTASASVYAWGAGWVSANGSCTANINATISSINYNNETGILTITATNCKPFVYLVQGNIQNSSN